MTLPAWATPTEYLANGSFETGDFTGWTQGGDTSFTSVTTGGYGPEDGSYSVFAGPQTPGTLSQTFADLPGEGLAISGWVTSLGFQPNGFTFLFNGAPVAGMDPIPAMPWTEFTATATATGLDTFTLTFYNVQSFDGYDNFSILGDGNAGGGDPGGGGTTSTPEPGTLLVLGTALLALNRVRRRRW